MAIIKVFQDGSIIEKDRGSFDDYCIYLTRPRIARHAPKDNIYFQRLIDLSKDHTSEKIYNDYVKIYELTNKDISFQTLESISKVASCYGNNSTEMDILYTILYLGMVAEENKANTKLGKRIKRLGMYQILVENIPANIAANFSRGMKWYDISTECEKRGF